ncbi:MAG TPA: pseudouridine synthase [Solimonas sp.]|nr:pseudouridine synthase [Solimonas sp.]
MSERIQKALATAGLASRREIERWIAEGRIMVNGRPAEIGQKVSHEDKVRVDGKLVAMPKGVEPARVLLFRKRVGELVTRDDPEGRRTVFRKLPELESGRWIAVGRLDINTSGLLLLTNDGELARRLTHPSFEITRMYAARVLGEIDDTILSRLRTGVELDDGPAHFESISLGINESGEDDDDAGEAGRSRAGAAREGGKANRWYIVTVRQGRNRLVRRLFESQGLQVSRLIRTAYGPIELGRGIKTGSSREATPAELAALLAAVGMEPQKPARAPKRPRRR